MLKTLLKRFALDILFSKAKKSEDVLRLEFSSDNPAFSYPL